MSAQAAEVLARAGAILTGTHVVYTSGRHGSVYINKDAVYPHTAQIAELCRQLAELGRPYRPEVVCGPALGGVILAQWTAHALGALAVYAEKVEGRLALRRGYDGIVRDRRVLVVEDVVNTGGSLRETVRAVRAAGGIVVAAVALVNRGGMRASDVEVPALHALMDLALDAWDAEACPLCRAGVPVNATVGKGREFLAARGRA